MYSIIFADDDATIDDVEFDWYNGYWHQETGSNINECKGVSGTLLCEELNRQRIKKNLLIGYGIKDLYGKIIYEIAQVVNQEFSHDEYDTMNGYGYYPFIKRDPNYPSYVNHLFVLHLFSFETPILQSIKQEK